MWIWVLLAVVVVIAALFALSRRPSPPVPAERLEECDMRLTHEARVAIGTAITRHRTSVAVALYRKHTGADLATSRAAIDRWSKGVRR